MYEDYKKEYIKKMRTFFKNISNYDLEGIPSIHIPAVGSLYEQAPSKLAIFGMETNGWNDLNETKDIFEKDENKGFDHSIKEFRNLDFIKWASGYFWGFNLQLLAKLYDINNYKDLMYYERYSFILKSFIWGNVNSLERFEITAGKRRADFETWKKVKEQSENIFDSAGTILKTCTPDVLIVLHWTKYSTWITKEYDLEWEDIELEGNKHFWYGYVEETDTHVLWLAHPRSMTMNLGFEETINSIHDCLKKHCITFELKSLYSAIK